MSEQARAAAEDILDEWDDMASDEALRLLMTSIIDRHFAGVVERAETLEESYYQKEREIEALRQQVDELTAQLGLWLTVVEEKESVLERWDQTEPAMQREIFLAFSARLTASTEQVHQLTARVAELENRQ